MHYTTQSEAEDLLQYDNSVDSIISQIRFGIFHVQLMFACGAGWMADNMWAFELYYVLPAVQKEFGLSNLSGAITITTECAGLFVGAIVWGRLSDQIGRKRAFMFTLMISGVFGTLSAFSVNYPMFLVLVFLFSTGVGGNLPVDGAMFGEFMSVHVRGPLMVLMTIFWVVGGTLGAGLCWALIPPYSCNSQGPTQNCLSENNRGWRYVMFITGLFNLTLYFLRFGIPESPRYLAKKGRNSEVKKVLSYVIQRNKANIILPDSIQLVETVELTWQESLKLLFSKSYIRTMIVLCCSWFFPFIGLSLFNAFLPELLSLKGSVTDADVYRNTFLYQASGIPGTLLAAWLLETVLGRKWTLFLATVWTGLSQFLFLIASSQSMTISFACLVMCATQIFFSSLYTYTPEVFPTEVRTTAVGLCSCFSRIAGAVAPLVGGFLLDNLQVSTLIYLGVSCIGFSALCMIGLDKETRGKELQ